MGFKYSFDRQSWTDTLAPAHVWRQNEICLSELFMWLNWFTSPDILFQPATLKMDQFTSKITSRGFGQAVTWKSLHDSHQGNERSVKGWCIQMPNAIQWIWFWFCRHPINGQTHPMIVETTRWLWNEWPGNQSCLTPFIDGTLTQHSTYRWDTNTRLHL